MDQNAFPQLPFRYATPSDEDLPALSKLAYRLSATQCGDCRNYHVMWPYLRSIGANGGGPELRWSDHVAIMARAAASRSHVRFLLGGSADAGQLALVAEAMRTLPGVSYEVTIVDRCATPLDVCQSYAATAGIEITTIVDELGAYTADEAFDVVLLHHTLVFIPGDERPAFLRHAANWLAPGGSLVISISFDRRGEPSPPPYQPMMAWREARIRDAAESGELELPEPLDDFLERLRAMRGSRRGPVGTHYRDDYEAAITDAGLSVIEAVHLPPEDHDPMGGNWRHRDRFMLVVQRPL